MSNFTFRPFRITWFVVLSVVGYSFVGWAAPILVLLTSADLVIKWK